MRVAATQLSADEVAKRTQNEHRRAFRVFFVRLIGDAERYLASGDVDSIREGAGYRLAGLWLNDAELAQFARELTAAVQPWLANTPTAGRRRRILAATSFAHRHDRDREHVSGG